MNAANPTYLLLGHDQLDIACFRAAVDDIAGWAIADVACALELICERSLAVLVVSETIGVDAATKAVSLIRRFHPDVRVVCLGNVGNSFAADAMVPRGVSARLALVAALGDLAVPQSVTRMVSARPPRPSADVLVVDTDRRRLHHTEDLLHANGYVAAGASSVRAARDVLRTTRVGLVVLPLDDCGLAIARRIRSGAVGAENEFASIVFIAADHDSARCEETFDLAPVRCVVGSSTGEAVCELASGLLHETAA